jgi:hypothetical protein
LLKMLDQQKPAGVNAGVNNRHPALARERNLLAASSKIAAAGIHSVSADGRSLAV